MERANVKKRSQKTLGDNHAKPSAKVDQKKNTVTVSQEDYDLLCDFARRASKVIEYLSDPEEIERQRIKQKRLNPPECQQCYKADQGEMPRVRRGPRKSSGFPVALIA